MAVRGHTVRKLARLVRAPLLALLGLCQDKIVLVESLGLRPGPRPVPIRVVMYDVVVIAIGPIRGTRRGVIPAVALGPRS